MKPAASAVTSVPPSTSPERQHGAQRRHPLAQGRGPLGEARVDQQVLDLGVLDDVRVVIERAQRMQRRGAAAGHLVGAHREEHLGTVRREHGDPAALRQAHLGERLGVAADLLVDLAAGEHPLAEVDAGRILAALEPGEQQMGNENRLVGCLEQTVHAHAIRGLLASALVEGALGAGVDGAADPLLVAGGHLGSQDVQVVVVVQLEYVRGDAAADGVGLALVRSRPQRACVVLS